MAWVARIKDVPVPQQSSSVLDSVADTMPSLRSLSKYAVSAFGASQSVLAGSANMNMNSLSYRDTFSSCPSPELSCHNTTAQANLCCFNSPGGSLLQTQFWDTSPPTGPSDSWTLHGLWPDNCDGTYEANCDSRRAYTNITEILQAAGADDTLAYMQKYWKDYQGDDESFWEHEWSKHGTCISTLDPDCYPDYQPTQEVPDFFNKTVSLFQSLPSYQFLSDAGIVPSTSQTYSSADIQAALSKGHDGMEVYLGCKSSALNEIWYFFNEVHVPSYRRQVSAERLQLLAHRNRDCDANDGYFCADLDERSVQRQGILERASLRREQGMSDFQRQMVRLWNLRDVRCYCWRR
jgi:ribonuclease T2